MKSKVVFLILSLFIAALLVGVAATSAPVAMKIFSQNQVEPATYFRDQWAITAGLSVSLANSVISAATRPSAPTRFAWTINLAAAAPRAGAVANSGSDSSAFELPAGATVDCALGDGQTTAVFCVWDPTTQKASLVVIDAGLGAGISSPYVRYTIAGIGRNESWRAAAGASVQKPRGFVPNTDAVFAVFSDEGDSQLVRVNLKTYNIVASSAILSRQRFESAAAASDLIACFKTLSSSSSSPSTITCYDTPTLQTLLVSTSSPHSLLRFVSNDRLVLHTPKEGGIGAVRMWKMPTAPPVAVPVQIGSYDFTTGDFYLENAGYSEKTGVLTIVTKKNNTDELEMHTIEAHWARSPTMQRVGLVLPLIASGGQQPRQPGASWFPAVVPTAYGKSQLVYLLRGSGHVYAVGPVVPSSRSRSWTNMLPPPPPPRTPNPLNDFPSASPIVFEQIGVDNTTRMALQLTAYLLAVPATVFAPTVAFSVMRAVKLDPLFCRGGRVAEAPSVFLIPLEVVDTSKGRATRGTVIIFCSIAFGLAAMVAYFKPNWSSDTGLEFWSPLNTNNNNNNNDDQEMTAMSRVPPPPPPPPPAATSPTDGRRKKKQTRRQREAAAALARQQEQEEQRERDEQARTRQRQQQQQREQSPQQRAAASNETSAAAPAAAPPKPRPLFSYIGIAIAQFLVPWSICAGFLLGLPELTGQALAVMPFVVMIIFFFLFTSRLRDFTKTPSLRTLRVAPAYVVRRVPIEEATPEMLIAEKQLGGSLGQLCLIGSVSWEIPVPAPVESVVEFFNCARLLFAPFWGPLETHAAIILSTGGPKVRDTIPRVMCRNWVLISSFTAVAAGILMGHVAINRDFCIFGRLCIIWVNFVYAIAFVALRPYIIPAHNVLLGALEVLSAALSLAMFLAVPDLDEHNISASNSAIVAAFEITLAAFAILVSALIIVFGLWPIYLLDKAKANIVNSTRRHLQVASNNLLAFLTIDFGLLPRPGGGGGGGGGGGDDNDDTLLPLHPPPPRPPNNNNNNNANNNRGGGGNDDDDDDDLLNDDPFGDNDQEFRSGGHDFKLDLTPPPQTTVPAAPARHLNAVLLQQQHQQQQTSAIAGFSASAPLTAAQQKHLRFHEFLERKAAEAESRNPGANKPKWVRHNSPYVQNAEFDRIDEQLDQMLRPSSVPPSSTAATAAASSPQQQQQHQQQQQSPSVCRSLSQQQQQPTTSKKERREELYRLTTDFEDMMTADHDDGTRRGGGGAKEPHHGLDQHLESRIAALLTPDQMARAAAEDEDSIKRQPVPAMRMQMVRLRRFFDRYNPAKSDAEVEQAVLAWAGRWDEMWASLGGLYGPEPLPGGGMEQLPAGTQWRVRVPSSAAADARKLVLDDSDSSPSPKSTQRQAIGGSGGSIDKTQPRQRSVGSSLEHEDDQFDHLTAERVENDVLKRKIKAMELELEQMKEKAREGAIPVPVKNNAGEVVKMNRFVLCDDDDDDDDGDIASASAQHAGAQRDRMDKTADVADSEVMSYDAVLSYLGVDDKQVAALQREQQHQQQQTEQKQSSSSFAATSAGGGYQLDDDSGDEEFLPAVKSTSHIRIDEEAPKRVPWQLL